MAEGVIELRGVSVNNLRHVDLDLPRDRLIVVCGVSGSGKTSLALDTLHAEGQRRYIETFSPYARQFLEQLDKPDAERIDGIPPSIAVTHRNRSRSARATVATATEIHELLSLLFARVGEVICHGCGRPVRRDTPHSAAEALTRVASGRRMMFGFDASIPKDQPAEKWIGEFIHDGYVRAVAGDQSVAIGPALAKNLAAGDVVTIVLDRLISGEAAPERLQESLEAALSAGQGAMVVYVQADAPQPQSASDTSLQRRLIDGRAWERHRFSIELRCDACDLRYSDPDPQLFNFNRPLGACHQCEGLGFIQHDDHAAPCPVCGGARLRPDALAVRVSGRSIAEIAATTVAGAMALLEVLQLAEWQRPIADPLIEDIRTRLRYLSDVGVGYLRLDRPLRSLSSGEAQRVVLTTALGSKLVGMLYVLDEPSVGLHPRDVIPLAAAIRNLQARGNSVIAVEHEEDIVRQADEVVEMGPGAGDEGGQVVFQGSPKALTANASSATGDWLAGRRGLACGRRRAAVGGRITLRGARGHNLQNISVEFPLGVLCLVTGVSGAGKSTLVEQTLYPALRRRLNRDATPANLPAPLEFDDLLGAGQLDEVTLIDQRPIGLSPRSNPVTYLKAFDPIRTLFAEQLEARTRGFTAGHFSFNVEGGRCEACRGDGCVAIDMQFMADVYVRCTECGGRRYRRAVLDVKYRGRSIAEVLDMTARDAFGWFRGERAVQARLKPLLDVGLDYLRLGQPATTLSGGEAQRLKLAAQLNVKRQGRTLFMLDEPTTGLHFSDVVKLIDCLEALLDVGHSLILIEHNLQLMKAADYLIDLGPGAAENGGRVVTIGTPEEVAACPDSLTGQFLAREFARDVARPGEPIQS